MYRSFMVELPDWSPRPDAADRRSSSLALCRAVLKVRNELTVPHVREALKLAVWKYTECDGKYTGRYRSENALFQPNTLVHHEHVFTIRSLVDQMLDTPARAERILSSAIGCVVLRSEHKMLGEVEKANPAVTGWDRYQLAGIRVWDLAERRRVV